MSDTNSPNTKTRANPLCLKESDFVPRSAPFTGKGPSRDDMAYGQVDREGMHTMYAIDPHTGLAYIVPVGDGGLVQLPK